ncbi:MAG: hypothetical protein Ta2E_09870 [Mycoplasmoidaceae bacterium]|nr:MAG: hypothetical protein Ta2E_09870 [Mycoplasmoidaceae bacterium]
MDIIDESKGKNVEVIWDIEMWNGTYTMINHGQE